MTSSKSTKRALLASVLSVMLCCAMLVGSTFAWFTDSVTSTGNIIKSGTLDVEMKWANGTSDPTQNDIGQWQDASEGAIFDYDLWEPGYTEVRHVRISNVGSLALKYEVRIAATGEVSELADVIDVYYIKDGRQIEDRTQLTEDDKIGTLTEVLAKPYAAKGNLLGQEGEKVDYDIATIALKMQEGAGNEYQGKSIGSEFAIRLVATQDTVEEDSFGPDYDKGAWLSEADTAWYTDGETAYTIDTEAELAGLAQLVNKGESFTGVTITLGADMHLNGAFWTPIGSEGTPFEGDFDGNGKTVYDLYVHTGSYAGLFGRVKGDLKDLTIETADVTGEDSVGVLVGSITGSVTDVTVNYAVVSGNHWLGGIAGYAYSDITGCRVTDITLTATPNIVDGVYDNGDKVGGIVGYLGEGSSTVTGCTVTDVTARAYRDVGGIAGAVNAGAEVSGNTVQTGSITADQTVGYYGFKEPNAGEIVGRTVGTVTVENNPSSDVTVKQMLTAEADTLSTTISAAGDGDTILVTEDVTASSTMLNLVQDKAVTVNLNGNALTYTGTDRSVQLAYGAEMTIRNGTINMPNVNDKGAGIFVYGTNIDEKTGKETAPCKLTMEDVTVNSSCLGVFSQGSGNEININDCVINSNYWGIYQNGSNSPSTFNITNSIIKDTAGAGVYISNSSADNREKQTLNITNSTVIGPTAVEIKHTNATITGSTLIGTATPTGSGTNNNGSCTTGYALAVTTNGTEDYVTGTVTVSDCEFYNGETSEGVPNGYCFVYTVADGSSVTIDGEAVSDYNTYGGETGSAG